MIITDNGKKLHYIKKIMNEQLHQVYRVRSDGTLEYDHQSLTGKYLAYIDGRWYGAHNGRHGSSEGSMEEIQNAKFLFAITQDRLWLARNDGTVEYSSPSKKLSDSTISFLLAKQSNKVCIQYRKQPRRKEIWHNDCPETSGSVYKICEWNGV